MFALGIILILVAAGVLLLAVLSSADIPATFELSGVSVTMDPLWVFLTGAMTVLLLVLGLELVRAGTRRAAKRRKEKKELHRRAQELEARESETRTTASEPSTRAVSSDTAVDTQATRTDGDVTDPNRPPQ
ncbi:MAG TPA: hypothetical protein VFR87_08630 [Nocardioidaceae bacterium]|nr:hypothetical protein [Nocardioidaceae bacterium]